MDCDKLTVPRVPRKHTDHVCCITARCEGRRPSKMLSPAPPQLVSPQWYQVGGRRGYVPALTDAGPARAKP